MRPETHFNDIVIHRSTKCNDCFPTMHEDTTHFVPTLLDDCRGANPHRRIKQSNYRTCVCDRARIKVLPRPASWQSLSFQLYWLLEYVIISPLWILENTHASSQTACRISKPSESRHCMLYVRVLRCQTHMSATLLEYNAGLEGCTYGLHCRTQLLLS